MLWKCHFAIPTKFPIPRAAKDTTRPASHDDKAEHEIGAVEPYAARRGSATVARQLDTRSEGMIGRAGHAVVRLQKGIFTVVQRL